MQQEGYLGIALANIHSSGKAASRNNGRPIINQPDLQAEWGG
jgi:hypothetical protein